MMLYGTLALKIPIMYQYLTRPLVSQPDEIYLLHIYGVPLGKLGSMSTFTLQLPQQRGH